MIEAIFSNLPDNWALTNFGEVVKDIEKVNPKENPNKSFIYIDIASIDNKNFEITNPKFYLGKDAPSRARQLIKSGDIVFSTVRTYLKNIAVVNEKYDGQIASTGFCVIRSNLVNNKLLFYLLQFDDFLNPLNKIQRGTSYPAIRNSDLFSQKIALPPLKEQFRIVTKIEELFTKLDAGIQELTLAKEKLKIYRQSNLKHAFEGKLTEKWRETHKDEIESSNLIIERINNELKIKFKSRFKPSKSSDFDNLAEIPNNWKWAKLGQVCHTTSGGTPSRKNNDYYGGLIPWLKSGELNDNIINQTEEFITEEGLNNSSAKLFPKGTLLIALYGATVGKLGLLGIDSTTNQAIAAIFTPNDLDKKFLFWFMLNYRNYLLESRIGGAQPNISQTILKEVFIPIFSIDEQKLIVEEIEQKFVIIEGTEKIINQNISRSQKLRQSILKNAFSGKLVPQDPNDEPAEKLLERIRAETEKQKPKRKIRKKSKSKQKELVK